MPRAVSLSTARADWLAARALLASKRLRPFVPYALGAFALVFAAVYAVRGPLANRVATTQRAAGRVMATGRDTMPLVVALQESRRAFSQRDSALRALQFRAEAGVIAPVLSARQQEERDSLRTLVTQLDGAVDRAAKAPLAASYHALATTRALSGVAGVQALVDTLDLLDRTRRALDPVAAPQSEFARLSQRANAIGSALQGISQSRRVALVRQITTLEAGGSATPRKLPLFDTVGARRSRDSAQLLASRADSALRSAREWHTAVLAQSDSLAREQAARILGASPFVAAVSALVMVMVLSFTMAVIAESRAPTIAHAREVERLTGLPVLARADGFRVPREGRARLQPATGVDPFRMVYLALTASGTKERAVCVTGDDTPTVTAVAARLAVSAAADEHATLVVDLAPGTQGASAYFGWRDEPGFTDALTGVRLWRECARPIGASEGMAIDVVPAGAPRPDADEALQSESSRSEFVAFVADYDFTVLVAPTPSAVELARVASKRPPTIVVARMAKTRLEALSGLVGRFRKAGVQLHGILLVDV